MIPTLYRLIDPRQKYHWQSIVKDAVNEKCRERLAAKIGFAERAIDLRLRTGPAPDIEEHCALSDALAALEDIALEQGLEELQDERKDDIA